MKISKIQVKWGILLCSVCLYILSLFLPAILYDGGSWSGGEVLALGWLGILAYLIAWFANPTFFIAVIAYIIVDRLSIAKRPNAPLFLTIIALVLGVTSFLAKGQNLSAGGPALIVTALGSGFYVWMLSFLILLIGCLIPSSPNPSAPPSNDTPVS